MPRCLAGNVLAVAYAVNFAFSPPFPGGAVLEVVHAVVALSGSRGGLECALTTAFARVVFMQYDHTAMLREPGAYQARTGRKVSPACTGQEFEQHNQTVYQVAVKPYSSPLPQRQSCRNRARLKTNTPAHVYRLPVLQSAAPKTTTACLPRLPMILLQRASRALVRWM